MPVTCVSSLRISSRSDHPILPEQRAAQLRALRDEQTDAMRADGGERNARASVCVCGCACTQVCLVNKCTFIGFWSQAGA